MLYLTQIPQSALQELLILVGGAGDYGVWEHDALHKEEVSMKHIKTLSTRDLKESMKKGGCGECQTSCQSACKTSCTVGNQSCKNRDEKINATRKPLI